MRILTRYIVFDLLKVFLFTLVSMTVFVFLVLVGKEAVENGLGLVPILRMVPYLLPQAMQFAVPGTMLLATTSVYGRIASSNEIVAVKSLGISPMVMVWPTLILATLVSFSAVVLNDVAVSWGRGGVQRVILESLEEIVYGRLLTKKTFSNNNVNISVRRVDGKRLIQPTILFFDSVRDVPVTITADEADIRADYQKQAIIIRFYNAEIEAGGSFSISHPGVLEYPLSLATFSGRHEGSRSPSSYSLREIGPSKTRQREEIERLKQEMTADAAFALMTGRTFELSQAVWQQRERQLYGAQETLHRLYTEPHRRWANGFSCLCFVLIGAPMAIRRRQAEFWGSFFACFLPILLVYYPMLVVTVDYAKDGVFPPQVVWLGNIMLAGWGAWFMQRVVKY
ncbi:MAG: LptF/LptG family permease [Planctomycetes bacterium]|nr:LptF/LptG family permease [Planctomycetota bacterium]